MIYYIINKLFFKTYSNAIKADDISAFIVINKNNKLSHKKRVFVYYKNSLKYKR